MAEIDLNHHFATPVWVTDIIVDNNPLIEFSLDLKSKGPGVDISNIGGWQSEKIAATESNQQILGPLVAQIHDLVNNIGTRYCFKKPLRVIDLWININEPGNFNMVHNHPGAILSGVYYIKSDGSGPLEIIRPSADAYFWQTFTDKSDNKETWTGGSYIPKDHRIIIFPAWVDHSVAPCDSQRISLAFNVGF